VTSSTPGAPAPSDRTGEVRTLFIYYRVASSQAAAARLAVEALQSRLREALPGLQTQLLRRPEEKDGQQTWMEIYSHPQGVSLQAQDQIEAAARELRGLGPGPRHVEVFVPCAS
jgi:hypothetical protein